MSPPRLHDGHAAPHPSQAVEKVQKGWGRVGYSSWFENRVVFKKCIFMTFSFLNAVFRAGFYFLNYFRLVIRFVFLVFFYFIFCMKQLSSARSKVTK